MVCHSGRIKGQPGVAMDDLVYICTKLARQIDAQVSPNEWLPHDGVSEVSPRHSTYQHTQTEGRCSECSEDNRRHAARLRLRLWHWPQGMDKAFEALEVATQMVEDARPLLNQAIELVDEARTHLFEITQADDSSAGLPHISLLYGMQCHAGRLMVRRPAERLAAVAAGDAAAG